MATFKMYNCDFVLRYNGTTYEFDHVDSVSIEDPETTSLVRGPNQSNKVGLIFTEGTKDPKTVTMQLIGIDADISALLNGIFEDKARCEFSVIDRTDGSGKIAKEAVISQRPQQLSIDESPESMNVQVIFKTFDLKEAHKS